MEEKSILSGSEISDSNSSSTTTTALPFFPGHDIINSGPAAPPSKFKGVVSQSNGNWGAQIYANHQRNWLGTFKSEVEAAMAYDSASITLRPSGGCVGGATHRNFPWTSITACEPHFQRQFTTEAVLNMIKDGTYAARFSEYLRSHGRQVAAGRGRRCLSASAHGAVGVRMRQLFQKELTPSDVSKLNRLVIPKKYAVKYFPRIMDKVEGQNGKDGGIMDLELTFVDRGMSPWKFRYCYWKSSQSFVFTRGWNRFAKDKGLKSMDKVIFYSYECGGKKMCLIDVAYNSDGVGAVVEGGVGPRELAEVAEAGLDGVERMDFEGSVVNAVEDVTQNVDASSANNYSPRGKGFKLFGVQII
ncbi:hypothetical protein ABFS82_11G034900 [Erythranthe guttata]|uniref:AP2/ERF and B3 domain-containing transcription factor At1g50680-like n=1 Tax=Erythranthe guttata TaxID=4155 RepID=UPI00064D9D56|nr:PREDICTED: AP2/ERF and B3 domain-containing transcription factor At1g50680-like [Erythranthe guttata]XP_012844129.1 PREDICTED: AP2/ERF and B3 domain-containing transcription factor At1g50680-like [Erythranthe guttata]|eukprot:XP_012844128.1 PREDICTED: AP2/ERF and B3 domain-containing transcription factor At1g50680-like [Erythranthe guttata]